MAGRLILDAGHPLEALHFSMEPFTDDTSARKSRVLAGLLGLSRLTIAPVGQELAQVRRACEGKYYFVLLKRFMVRLAHRVASQKGATFLVTGENLGQVSSQTLPNLGVIDAISTLPILRPLLGLDKREILARAEAIGTFETSKGPEVCDVLGPRYPATAAALDRILVEESHLNWEDLMASALDKAFEVETTRDVAALATPVATLARSAVE